MASLVIRQLLFNIGLIVAAIISSFHVIHGFHINNKAMRVRAKSNVITMVDFDRASGTYLDRMVRRRKAEVDNLLRRHQSPDDPLIMRLTYLAENTEYNITRSIRKPFVGEQQLSKMSIIVDMKRKSPTVPAQRDIVDYRDAGEFCELLTNVGVDAFLINGDETEYGVGVNELSTCSKRLNRNMKIKKTPGLIYKDVIVHPIQIAQALENGASGVLLIMAVVGADLEDMLDACTTMGCEAVVEVHSPQELEYALGRGATIFLVNMWDRMSGQLYPEQYKFLTPMMPINCVAMAAGNIRTLKQVYELGYCGYDGVVIGRNLAEMDDIQAFVKGVHDFTGPPRLTGMGMKASEYSVDLADAIFGPPGATQRY